MTRTRDDRRTLAVKFIAALVPMGLWVVALLVARGCGA